MGKSALGLLGLTQRTQDTAHNGSSLFVAVDVIYNIKPRDLSDGRGLTDPSPTSRQQEFTHQSL